MGNVETRDDVDSPVKPAETREIGALEAFWSFFSSMKTAIVLLLALAAAATVGTIIEDKTGVSVYGSTWFSMILTLVGVNLAVCTINRFGIAWRRTFEPSVDTTPERVSAMTRSEAIPCADSPSCAADKLTSALRSGSFRLIKRSKSGEAISIYAAKGRASIWGPYLTHLSLLVIFAGAIFGNMLGSEGYTTITEGHRATDYVPKGSQTSSPLGFEVALRDFTIKHDKNNHPIGYNSDLQVYDGGRLVTAKVIDVNHPLTYNGVSFYQSDYGLAGLVIKLTAPNGEVARVSYAISTEDTAEGRAYVISDDPWRQCRLAGKNLTLFVHNLVPDYVGGSRISGSVLPLNPGIEIMINDRFPAYKGLDAWKRLGWMTTSKSAHYKGLTVAVEKVVSYTGLQVSRNPGLPAIYLGFALMILGVFLSFYVTHKTIRASIVSTGSGLTVTFGGTSRAEPTVFDRDFERIRGALTGPVEDKRE